MQDTRTHDDIEWLPVPGFEGCYEVSSTGVVRSLDRGVRTQHGSRTTHGVVLKPRLNRAGYLRVNLSVEQRHCARTIHTIVAAAFHGEKPSAQHHAAHYDGNKLNNSASNIRWATPQENSDDQRRLGRTLLGVPNPATRKLDLDSARRIRAEVANGVPQRQLARRYAVSAQTICNVVHNRFYTENAT